MSHSPGRAIALTAFLASSVVTACSDRQLAAQPPAEAIKVVGDPVLGYSVTITLAQGAKLNDAFEMRLFGDFTPGITLEQARARFGKPNGTRVDNYGVTWFQYETSLSRVEIGEEQAGSGASAPQVIGWRLYAYPRKGAVDSWMPPQFAKAVEQRAVEVFVLPHRSDEPTERVHCWVQGRTVAKCGWY